MIILVMTGVAVCFSQSDSYFRDEDLDGVEDPRDKCPGTPFLVLVDKNGCPIERVKPRYYLRYGASYTWDKGEITFLSLLTFAVSYKKIYFSVTGRYYHSFGGRSSGLGNSTLYGSYTLRFEDLYLAPGIRIKVPTGDRRFTDRYTDVTFSIVADIFLDGFDLVFFGSYTVRGNPSFRNTYTLSAGPGYYFTDRFYANVSYGAVSSAVTERLNHYASLFVLLDIAGPLYSTLSYSRGLSGRAVDNTLTVRLGLRF